MKTPSNERRRALIVLAMILVVLAALATGLTRLRKEPSVDALVPTGSHALQLRATVRETFGLKDPLVVALATDRADGILDLAALRALHQLTAALREVAQIDPDQVFSLATEQGVRSEGDALHVEPLLPAEPLPADAAEVVKRAVAGAPMYRGTLVAEDFSAALIAAELREGADAADAYEAGLARVRAVRLPAGVQVQVAGEATSAGFLSRFIDRDLESASRRRTHSSPQRMAPAQTRKSGVVLVGGHPLATGLDCECGVMGIRHQIAGRPGLYT